MIVGLLQGALVLTLVRRGVWAQDGVAKDQGAQEGGTESVGTAQQAEPAPPSLDDLLGIEEDEDTGEASAAEAAAREQRERLERALAERELKDLFTQAIADMSISADLLDESFDAGLGTQRVQETILSRLETLLEQARKMQNQQSSSQSSSSSSRSEQQQEQNPGQRSNQQSQTTPGSQRQDQPGDSQEGEPPPVQDEVVNPMIEETRTEWGNLPEREREMMRQGSREKYSSLYERLTQEYYRRLAEDNRP
jgi:hypothetical protein